MSLQTRLAALITAVGADIKDLKTKTALLASAPVEAWHTVGAVGEPAFANGWTFFDATSNVRFRKYPDGRVRLEGLLKSGTIGQVAFTLPVGYRPNQVQNSAVDSNSLFGAVLIYTNGDVVPLVGSNTWVSLSNLEFDTGTSSAGPVLITNVKTEGWHTVGAVGEPAYENAWLEYDAARPCRFKKYPDGRVRLEGLVKSGVNGTAAFTLPVGYRPAYQQSRPVMSNNLLGQVNIFFSGFVFISAPSSSTWVDLSSIEFDTGQTTFPAGKTDIPTVTALTPGPTDGDEIYFQTAAMKTAGIKWHLQYDGGAPGLYKWIVLGGGPLTSFLPGQVSTTSSSNVDLSGGPTITVPLAGDYQVEHGAQMTNTIALAYATAEIVIAGVATGNYVFTRVGAAGAEGGNFDKFTATAVAAASVIKQMYRIGGSGTAAFQRRHLTVMPIRVG